MKKIILSYLVAAFFLFPGFSHAAPQAVNVYPFNHEEVTARAYIVTDRASGQVLLQKDADLPWVPASLTKLVTAMVVLDMNPELAGKITMIKQDEVGGTRIATKAGVTYTVKDLFYTALVASANNATNALSRSSGLSPQAFVDRMNQKVAALGATQTKFVEPTGMSPENRITAADYAKIAAAAFEYSKIQDADGRSTYNFSSVGAGKKYTHKLKTTNRLLGEGGFLITGAKTGYLDESKYNFAAELKDVDGKNIIVVLLGSRNSSSQFFETKKLAIWSWLNYKWGAEQPVNQQPQVAGAFVGLQMPASW